MVIRLLIRLVSKTNLQLIYLKLEINTHIMCAIVNSFIFNFGIVKRTFGHNDKRIKFALQIDTTVL